MGNDRAAYRAYGPALQEKGERAFGYDIWTKNVPEPVVEDRYDGDLNQGISYHIDHGNGMDCYAVGPTLGGGTAALFPDSTIVYPYCYKDCEVLDNGPLRFTTKLVYNPLVVKRDSNVIETRIISLDKGSQLNKTVVSFDNLQETTPVVTGIVLHKQNPTGYSFDANAGYIAYADSTENAANNNGVIYIGAVFPANIKGALPQMFSEKSRKNVEVLWGMCCRSVIMNRVPSIFIIGDQAGANMVSKPIPIGTNIWKNTLRRYVIPWWSMYHRMVI